MADDPRTKPGEPGDPPVRADGADDRADDGAGLSWSSERLPSADDSLSSLPLSSSSPSTRSLGDSAADALLREIAHAPPRRPPSEVAAGTRWSESGRFVIERPLGRGGMGSVYAARDTLLERAVAIKVLDGADADPAHNARLLREAKLAARVEHERIARVYDVGTHNGFGFVAMEYVQGGTLRQSLKTRRLALDEVLTLATQIAEGLAAMHAEGLVHGDLKPENVLLTEKGGVKLVDFGLARSAVIFTGEAIDSAWVSAASEASLQLTGGTPGYMAPEQYEGQHGDPRIDVFALGVIIGELVLGKRLLRDAAPTASSASAAIVTLRQATREAATRLRGEEWDALPAELRHDVARMLARDPAERFSDGAEVFASLRKLATPGSPTTTKALLPPATARALGEAATQHAVPSSKPPTATPKRRITAKHLGLGSGLAALGAIAAVQLIPDSPAPASPPDPIAASTAPPVPPAGMVLIAGGELDVGRTLEEIDRECQLIGAGCDRRQMLREVPRTRVKVAPFFLDRDEVTNEAYAEMLNTFTGILAVVDDEDHHVPRFVHRNAGASTSGGTSEVLIDLNAKNGGIEYVNRRDYRVREGRARLPAAQVSWYGAKLYCESRGKRLPTENEWEAAARGAEDRRFPWGNELPRCPTPALAARAPMGADASVASVQINVPNDGQLGLSVDCPVEVSVRPVGAPGAVLELSGNVAEWVEVSGRSADASQRDITPEGVRDLGGNVAEWTSDTFVEDNRASHAATGSPEQPRVIRGGSWGESVMARSSGRNRRPPSVMGANLGFRCAADLPSTAPTKP